MYLIYRSFHQNLKFKKLKVLQRKVVSRFIFDELDEIPKVTQKFVNEVRKNKRKKR